MANPNHLHERTEFSPKDGVDDLLGHGSPNPLRIGCPERDVLIALARRERTINDPAYEHLASCSPCYREFRRFQDRYDTAHHPAEPARPR